MGRRGLRESGQSVHTRHAYLPCGKEFHSKKNTVDKLVAMHKKVCDVCSDDPTVTVQTIHTDARVESRARVEKAVAELLLFE